MVKELSGIQTTIDMKVNGKTTKLTVSVHIFIQMEPYMSVNGKMICNMVSEKKPGLMGLLMKENILKGKNKVKDFTYGVINLNTQGCGILIKLMDMVFTSGRTVVNFREIGSKI